MLCDRNRYTVTGSNIVQQEVGIRKYRFSDQNLRPGRGHRLDALTGLPTRLMTGVTTDVLKDLFARLYPGILQQKQIAGRSLRIPHESSELVDVVLFVVGFIDMWRIAYGSHFVAKQPVGDTHFVEVRVC